MKVLVTGASGYVGSRLVPRLLQDGHEVAAAFSDAGKASAYWWRPDVEVVTMDVLDPGAVAPAVDGVEAVYYLIHGLGRDDFAQTDRKAARTLAEAAAAAGVQRLVYLSGLVPDVPEDELSEHITSRREVERVLTGSGVTTITLRAAVVTGSGSTSFEIVRQLTERLPVETIPTWMNTRVQPIAVVDVCEALTGALTVAPVSRSYDVGGPDRLPYADLLRRYAEVAGLTRAQVTVPGLPTGLVGRLAGMITDVDNDTVEALVESLHHDMVCRESDFVDDLLPPGHRLVGLDESFRRAVAKPVAGTDPSGLDPMGPMPHDPPWAGGSDNWVSAEVTDPAAALSSRGRRTEP